VEETGCLQSSGSTWDYRAVVAAASSETLNVKHSCGLRSASSSSAASRPCTGRSNGLILTGVRGLDRTSKLFDDQILIGGWRRFIPMVNKNGICTIMGKNGNANTPAQLSEFAEFRRKQNFKEHELILL